MEGFPEFVAIIVGLSLCYILQYPFRLLYIKITGRGGEPIRFSLSMLLIAMAVVAALSRLRQSFSRTLAFARSARETMGGGRLLVANLIHKMGDNQAKPNDPVRTRRPALHQAPALCRQAAAFAGSKIMLATTPAPMNARPHRSNERSFMGHSVAECDRVRDEINPSI